MNKQIFREYDIRGVADKDLTDDVIKKIGKAYGSLVASKKGKAVSVGMDCRVSSPRIKKALTEGVNSAGIDVVDIGMVTTPLLYYSLHKLKIDGGIMVTGSHNPPQFNGLKICLGKNTLHGQEIQGLRIMIEREQLVEGKGKASQKDIVSDYIDYVSGLFDFKRKVKVVVDCGNGSSGPIVKKLFSELNVEATVLYGEPDGTFPNHEADPTVPKNMEDLIGKVKDLKADIGIAYDGDADRIGVVDSDGKIVWGDKLLVIYARELLKEHKGATVIGEVKCSRFLFEDIKAHGGKPIMWRVGHSVLKAKMKEEKAMLAGEMSGHMFFGDRWFGYDDAIYASCRLLEILDKNECNLAELTADFPKLYATPEIRTECPDERKFYIVKQLVDYFKERYDVVDIDGARVNFEHGWGLVRASNTQPVLVMRFEADSEENLREIRGIVEEKVKEFSS